MGPYLSHRFSPGGCCWDEMPGRSDPLFGFDIALFGLLVHAFAPSSMRENNPHTCRQRVQKNVPRAVVGFDMFVGWQFLRDEYDEILLILTQGRKQPLTSCTNQTRPQISYAIFWFNQIFCRNLTEQIHISTRHMLSSASAGTLARPWKTASAC